MWLLHISMTNYTKNHWIIHFKWASLWYKNYMSKNLFKNEVNNLFLWKRKISKMHCQIFKRLLDWEKSVVQDGGIFKILLTKIMIYLARKAERLPLARGMSTFSHSIQIPFIVSVWNCLFKNWEIVLFIALVTTVPFLTPSSPSFNF